MVLFAGITEYSDRKVMIVPLCAVTGGPPVVTYTRSIQYEAMQYEAILCEAIQYNKYNTI